MNWQQACQHIALGNMPFKIEINEHGDLILSPAKVRHGVLLAQLRHDGMEKKIEATCLS